MYYVFCEFSKTIITIYLPHLSYYSTFNISKLFEEYGWPYCIECVAYLHAPLLPLTVPEGAGAEPYAAEAARAEAARAQAADTHPVRKLYDIF